MKRGGWFPIDERMVALLPKDRPYTKLEALLSLQADIHKGNAGSIAGYASLWGWSRDKVRRFITPLKEGIDHFVDRKATGNRHPIHICFRELDNESDSKPTQERQKADPTIKRERGNKKKQSYPSSPQKSSEGGNDGYRIDYKC